MDQDIRESNLRHPTSLRGIRTKQPMVLNQDEAHTYTNVSCPRYELLAL